MQHWKIKLNEQDIIIFSKIIYFYIFLNLESNFSIYYVLNSRNPLPHITTSENAEPLPHFYYVLRERRLRLEGFVCYAGVVAPRNRVQPGNVRIACELHLQNRKKFAANAKRNSESQLEYENLKNVREGLHAK
jgi:hypothetical protein